MHAQKRQYAIAILLCTLLWIGAVRADVIDSSAVGFMVKNAVVISANPDDVYRRLIDDVGQWWNSEHTFSGNSHNLYIEPKADGCFGEKLENGGCVRHLDVVYALPGKTLRLRGGLGPLQSMAVTGSMTWSLTKKDNGTTVEVTYTVGGYAPNGLQKWASPVNTVLLEQMQRLKSYIETGKPTK